MTSQVCLLQGLMLSLAEGEVLVFTFASINTSLVFIEDDYGTLLDFCFCRVNIYCDMEFIKADKEELGYLGLTPGNLTWFKLDKVTKVQAVPAAYSASYCQWFPGNHTATCGQPSADVYSKHVNDVNRCISVRANDGQYCQNGINLVMWNFDFFTNFRGSKVLHLGVCMALMSYASMVDERSPIKYAPQVAEAALAGVIGVTMFVFGIGLYLYKTGQHPRYRYRSVGETDLAHD
ncbi:uncharacterized protein LOC131939611 [Physella acuta]|uniref:uncharacterized protein LOC131939611 n=1 Tax=Physella acuta TaxID=109671 RepID=UPI0027DC22B7|nr:uncharacterized protein LOC131939611 [Physella acuta]